MVATIVALITEMNWNLDTITSYLKIGLHNLMWLSFTISYDTITISLINLAGWLISLWLAKIIKFLIETINIHLNLCQLILQPIHMVNSTVVLFSNTQMITSAEFMAIGQHHCLQIFTQIDTEAFADERLSVVVEGRIAGLNENESALIIDWLQNEVWSTEADLMWSKAIAISSHALTMTCLNVTGSGW